MNSRSWTAVIALVAVGGGALLLDLRQPPAAAPEAEGGPPANGWVALLTDYGTTDQYVGILKGAMVAANPNVKMVDITHEVPSFDIAAGAYLLSQVAPQWPAGTTFLVVVDPTVGTTRGMIAAETWPDGHRYVAPDNGVLTDVLAAAQRVEIHALQNTRLANPKLDQQGVLSSTFHGRDWFGPVAAHLAGGTPLAEVGDAVEKVVGLPRVEAAARNQEVVGTVVYVDHYGNLLTNIPRGLLDQAGFTRGGVLAVRFGEGEWWPVPWVGTYADVPIGELLLTANTGAACVELAINQGHAGRRLGVQSGTMVTIRAGNATEQR